MARPQLREGYTWGPDLTLRDLVVGDDFETRGSPRCCAVSGRIVKLTTARVQYERDYMGKPVTVEISKRELYGAHVLRGVVMHEIK